jgi:large subunit ribosomal protein L15
MPLQRRLPKRGFKNPFRVEYAPVSVGRLGDLFAAGEVVDPEAMRAKGLVARSAKLMKVLGNGQISNKLTVKAHAFSRSAKEKIEAAGGAVEVIEFKRRKPVKGVKRAQRGQ